MSTKFPTNKRTGVLGGTFDPIHLGHISVAEAAAHALTLDEVLVIPSHDPPHRSALPHASPYHRFAMVALAVSTTPRLKASDLELLATGVSYSSTTLKRLGEAGYDRSQLFFITGADAFAEIATWKDYPDFLALSHFVVVSRPGWPASALRDRLPALVSRMRVAADYDPNELSNAEEGRESLIFLIDVATPDVSSTEIREHLQDGRRIDGLVPPGVARHIHQHQLYSLLRGGSIENPPR